MEKISTIAQIAAVLANSGFKAKDGGNFVSVQLGSAANPVNAIINLSDKNMYVACELAKVSDLRVKQFNQAMCAMIIGNTSVLPYAFTIHAEGKKLEKSPITLINSVPMGDLSEQELIAAVDSLQVAVNTGAEIIKPYMKIGR